ncbi:MAG: hypothetical protein A3J52_01600 [Omnitrophica bacterium RIFCSPHIGHO2_02_FULL_49_9]|nr:MAG: hypothetical protein A3J52_01600 [Omnitrophica bacterium RIFCSPHIGHO2_02_FULL_49_9]
MSIGKTIAKWIKSLSNLSKVTGAVQKIASHVIRTAIETAVHELQRNAERLLVKYGLLLLGTGFFLWGTATYLDQFFGTNGAGFWAVGLVLLVIGFLYPVREKSP